MNKINKRYSFVNKIIIFILNYLKIKDSGLYYKKNIKNYYTIIFQNTIASSILGEGKKKRGIRKI